MRTVIPYETHSTFTAVPDPVLTGSFVSSGYPSVVPSPYPSSMFYYDPGQTVETEKQEKQENEGNEVSAVLSGVDHGKRGGSEVKMDENGEEAEQMGTFLIKKRKKRDEL